MARPSVPTRRSDILSAARAVFSARGYAGTRMEDIAKRAGISKAALYLQFASKQDLFESAVIELIEGMLPAIAPADFGDIPAEALLRGMIGAVSARLAQDDVGFVPRVIIGEGQNFPELARFYYENAVSRGLAILERIIRHGVARGEFACSDPALACRSVIGGVLVAMIWKRVFEPVGAPPVDPADVARVHAEVILNGLKTRKEAGA